MKFSRFLHFISVNIEIINVLFLLTGVLVYTCCIHTTLANAIFFSTIVVVLLLINYVALTMRALDLKNGTTVFSRGVKK